MLQSTPIVAFDQHAASLVAAVLLPGQGTPAVQTLTPDLPTVRRFLQRLRHKGPVQCCYEAGPCGFDLQRALVAEGIARDVIAPALIPPPARRPHQDRPSRCGAARDSLSRRCADSDPCGTVIYSDGLARRAIPRATGGSLLRSALETRGISPLFNFYRGSWWGSVALSCPSVHGVRSSRQPSSTAGMAGARAFTASDVGTLSGKFSGLARVMDGRYVWPRSAGVRSVGDALNPRLIETEYG
jgi:hypothetical protein